MRNKLIIVGAGIAGLSACVKLIEQDFDVMILEARARCGGRIWTDHTMGFPLSLGAAWIHGIEENPIAKLAINARVKMAPIDPSQFCIFDRHGEIIPSKIVHKFDEKFNILLTQAKTLATQAESDISLADTFKRLINLGELSEVESDLYERKLRFFEGYLGASYEYLSARNWDQEETWPGDNCYLISSYQPIIDELQKRCPVKLNTIVREIVVNSTGVEVRADNAIFHSDAVLITVPLSILQNNDINFNPPLPQDKLMAIKRLGMGVFNITALRFAEPFWPEEKHALFFTEKSAAISVYLNLYSFTKEALLIGYSGSKAVIKLENLTDKQLSEKLFQDFKAHFGSKASMPISSITTRWSRDPFSLGSYSFVQTGSSGNDYITLAKPVLDKLYFAGEATCKQHPATTHGAYLSGIREAENIINSFKQ